MSILLQDLCFAVRSLRRHPLFTAIGVLTLALGIGLNSAVFPAIDAVLLGPISGVRAPEEIVNVYRTWPGGNEFGPSLVPHFRDVQAHSADVFTQVAAWTFNPINVSYGGRNERIFGGSPPGRGDGFGGDPDIIGRQVVLNGQSYTIVGVAPASFTGIMPALVPALHVPLVQLNQIQPGTTGRLQVRGKNFMNVFARLKPGVTLAQAESRLTTVNNALAEGFPDDYRSTGMQLIRQADAGIHPSFRDTQVPHITPRPPCPAPSESSQSARSC